eukprot:TRINITY_DN1588_c0_g1_i5.p1 TRINITY_DN1588_c0_g1~~TRINITY_DN1588_c0_g1_i5.p1  ORF type:complete len:238 (+),score=68.10 TRINITY_DN1588_c0_g1_i5:208-921(+)
MCIRDRCGFEMEIEQLDGRKLIVRSTPGEVVSPVIFDPLKEDEEDAQWEVMENMDVTLEDVARAESTDVDALKKAVSKGQLRGKDIGCFITYNGTATFKQGTREECLAATKPKKGAKLYILADPDAAKSSRMMKCVVGEGLPTFRDQTEFGNLFIILTIEFPESMAPDACATLRDLLPAPLNSVSAKEGDENVDVCTLETRDPVQSYEYNKPVAQDDEDDSPQGHGMGGQNVQCAQQ